MKGETMSKSEQKNGRVNSASRSDKGKRHTEEGVLFVLLVLSGIGIAVSDFAPREAFWYWVAMAPFFWLGCVSVQWSRTKARGESRGRLIRRQLFHWIGYVVAVYLVFLLQTTGRLNSADAGLVALLVLAFSTFFAGIYCDWRIILVGVFLGTAVAGSALLEEYLWLLLLPVGVILILAIILWRYRRNK